MPEMTPEQQLAVSTLDKPFALIAGAGSGKTTVLVERYLALLRQGVSPQSILTVTFTNEAADQLKERVLTSLSHVEPRPQKLMGSIETTPNIGTIHSFCYSLLDQYGSAIDLKPISKILSPFDLAEAFELSYQEWLENLPEAELAQYLEILTANDLKTAARQLFEGRFLFTPDAETPLASLVAAVKPLQTRLEQSFRNRGWYTFDELEHLSLRILTECPAVRERLQTRISHVCVDEFQDTSRTQWEILNLLIGGNLNKLFVVGDPKQSIYGFRHADVSLFLEISREIDQAGGIVAPLSFNFRSQPLLLDDINHISGHLFKDSIIPFAPMVSGRLNDGPTPRLRVQRYGIETSDVVRATRALLDDGHRPESILLLFRVSDRIIQYFNALAAVGIPVRCEQSGKLFQCYDVLYLIHYLEAILNPLDDFHFAALLRSPYFDFSYADLWNLRGKSSGSLFENAATDKRLGWFVGLIENGVTTAEEALTALFRNTRYFPVQRDAIHTFLTPLIAAPQSLLETITAIRRWRLDEIPFHVKQTSGGHHGVSLMTVHGAKGLEYPHVFLVDNLRASPKRSPTVRIHLGKPPELRYRQDGEPVLTSRYEELTEAQRLREADESKRILYVALTRARETLTIFLPREGKIPKGSWGELLEEVLKETRGQEQEVPF